MNFSSNLLRGDPSFTLNSNRPAPCRSPASAFSLAWLAQSVHRLFCFRTSPSIEERYLSNWWVETVTGPEIISGVRASSIRMLSTSSMIE